MNVADSEFTRLIAEGLQFDCPMAMYSAVPKGYTTHWRIMPTAVTAGLVSGSARTEIEDQKPFLLLPGMGICPLSSVPPRRNRAAKDGFEASANRLFTIPSVIFAAWTQRVPIAPTPL